MGVVDVGNKAGAIGSSQESAKATRSVTTALPIEKRVERGSGQNGLDVDGVGSSQGATKLGAR